LKVTRGDFSMGGQKGNRRKFRAKKISRHWKKVNDPRTFRNKHKRMTVFHSIFDDLNELDELVFA